MRGAEGLAPGRRGSEGLWKGDLKGRGLDEPGDGLAVEGDDVLGDGGTGRVTALLLEEFGIEYEASAAGCIEDALRVGEVVGCGRDKTAVPETHHALALVEHVQAGR